MSAQPAPRSLRAIAQKAMELYRQALAADVDWDKVIEFTTRLRGPAKASLKTMFFHALLHSQRHYAQLGTLVRQHGHAIEGPGDYLLMGIAWR